MKRKIMENEDCICAICTGGKSDKDIFRLIEYYKKVDDNQELIRKREYYENGQIEEEYNFKDGKEDGKYTSYYENGKLKEEGKLEEAKKFKETASKNYIDIEKSKDLWDKGGADKVLGEIYRDLENLIGSKAREYKELPKLDWLFHFAAKLWKRILILVECLNFLIL